ncbi:hypothetical protein HF888_07670 [Bermanella marisrubri]|uniref:DNA topoisomerase I n=1 Tax=Bermanella marisrubri TaxID=207949 RepID=Q1N4S0_9GAMM|nr:hypothetical protein [Bermanella marisrubri]EAT13358.1 DNA topoisomerase I [Oceanobacter sp. RED65] [Bermanella marisrubri]QIZ84114.1 hypothetical protein HF888_07670 [Bermanella marisrubri]
MIIFIVIISIVLIAGALMVAHHMSVKEKKLTEQRLRGKRILVYANEIWDALSECSKLIDAPDILHTLMDYYRCQMRHRDGILGEDNSQTYENEIQSFKDKISQIHVVQQLDNDNEINHAKRIFSKASKYIKSAANRKLLGQGEANTMRTSMKRRMLDLQVSAYERLGDEAGERSDPATATNYYKYAKKLLIETNLTFDGKIEWVRKISHKNQVLFGNAVAEKLEKQIDEEENTVDEFGIPKDTNVLAGNKKAF